MFVYGGVTRWSLIAGRIPGRTDNEIKNYWNTHLSKKLISQGIDPRTHKPLILMEPNYDNKQPPSSSSRGSTDRDDRRILADHDHHPNSTDNNNTSSAVFPSMEQEDNIIGATVERNIYVRHDDNQFLQSAEMSIAGNRNENIMQSIADGDGGDDMMSGMMMKIIHEGLNNENDDHYSCSDDMVSSFLNSLITTEDVFINSQSLVEQEDDDDANLIISSSTPLENDSN